MRGLSVVVVWSRESLLDLHSNTLIDCGVSQDVYNEKQSSVRVSFRARLSRIMRSDCEQLVWAFVASSRAILRPDMLMRL